MVVKEDKMARKMHVENLDYLRGKLEGLVIGQIYARSISYYRGVIDNDFFYQCLSDHIDEVVKKMEEKQKGKK